MSPKKKSTIKNILVMTSIIIGISATIGTYGRKIFIDTIDRRIEYKVGYDVKLLTYMVRELVGDSIAREAEKKLEMFKPEDK